MKLNADFYFQLEASAGPLYRAIGKVAQEQSLRHPLLQVQSGRAESPAWYLVQAAEFAPEPLTVANIRIRDVYASEAIARAILEMMAAERWLDRRGDAYHLTELGIEVTQELLRRGPTLLAQVEVPDHVDLVRLEGLLRRVIDASMVCDTPPGNWCLAHSRNRAPSDTVSPPVSATVRLLQYFSDFNAFRDDAHMAAWQPLSVTGHEWETFAFVVSGQADTAVSLYEQLTYRGYSIEDFAHALAELGNRGWLVSREGKYYVMEEGRQVHAKVEGLTDRYFYAPWHEALSAAEVAEVVELLRVLREKWEV